jgi:hypothetical protein
MKYKNWTIFTAIGLAVLIGAGALFLSSSKKAVPAPIAQVSPEEIVSTMEPEEIGLTLTTSSDNKKVILGVANTKGISALDYELSYTSKGDIPRGVIGHIDIEQAGKKILQEITLGTCSDVCHYDEDVSDIKLILKVSKTDGTTSQVKKSLEPGQ